MGTLLRIPLLLTVVALIAGYFIGGVTGLLTVAILGIVEITLSFDNAVVNSKVLLRLSPFWQRMFLGLGLLIAVGFMRLLFPLIVVAAAAHTNPLAALQLAIQQPHLYAKHLADAHSAIAAFGGVFLTLLFLDWVFEDREVQWLKPIEKTLCKLGRVENMSIVVTAVLLVVISTVFGHTQTVLLFGILGLATYLIVNSLDLFFNEEGATKIARVGFATFLYLEVLDASFSFDNVTASFAITSNIFLIALGLGIGAAYVRGFTVYLVRKGTLAEYIYLDHGAHWAIGVLAILLLVTIRYEIPDVVTGLLGVGFISAAFISSLIERKQHVRNRSTQSINAKATS